MAKARERTKVRGVYERVAGSNVWSICYYDSSGKKRRELVGRKSAAIDLYRKRKTEVLERKKLPEKFRAKTVTFAALAVDALEYSRSNKVSYTDDQYRMKLIVKRFGDCPADALLPQEFERWLNAQVAAEGWKPATCNRYRALISLAYRIGIKNRKVSTNPARAVQHRRENNGRIRFMDEDEEKVLREAILDCCPIHLSEFEIALHTGMRRSEQYRLTWDCIDLEQRLVTIPLSKNGEVRHIRLNTKALAVLEALCRRSGGLGPVFTDEHGNAVLTPRRWFDSVIKASGITNFSWHCLRHTFASRLIMRGAGLRDVQDAMGHKTISMTCRYAHLAPSHQLAVVERLCDNEPAPQNGATDTTTDTGHISRGAKHGRTEPQVPQKQ